MVQLAEALNQAIGRQSVGMSTSPVESQQINQLQLKPAVRVDLIDILNNLHEADQKQSLLSSLNNILTTGRSASINQQQRMELVEGVISDIKNPFNMSQADKSTCQAFGILGKLAYEQPATYAKLVEQVTSSSERSVLDSGDTLELLTDSINIAGLPNDSTLKERSLVQKIMQSSVMHLAGQLQSTDLVYKPGIDTIVDLSGGRGVKGLDPHMFQRARNSIFNSGSMRIDTVAVGGVNKENTMLASAVLEKAQQGLQEGKNIIAAELKWGTANHQQHCVAIHRIEADRVYFAHSWGTFQSVSDCHQEHFDSQLGKLESMSRVEFERRLRSVYLDGPLAKQGADGRPELTAVDASRLYDPNPVSRDTDTGPQVFCMTQGYNNTPNYELSAHKSMAAAVVTNTNYVHPAATIVDLKKEKVTAENGGQVSVYQSIAKGYRPKDELF